MVEAMRKMLKTTALSFLVFYLAAGVDVCLCSDSDEPDTQRVTGEQSTAFLGIVQGSGIVVTASLSDPHDGENECSHTAVDKAESPAVVKHGKTPVPTVPALSYRASTQWLASGDIESPFVARDGDREHDWLISVRSIVLLL